MNILKKDHGISECLCRWYNENKRDLPWRHTNDPYKIWLSEIILQQTRVNQGLSYYLDFIQSFPDVFALAAASQDEVLKHWQGLGYYSRARNMHHTAQLIVSNFQGKFPDQFEQLLSLKGVGRYTASAIASFAFDLPYPVLDGNVYRVLARLFNIDIDIRDKEAPRLFYELAENILDEQRPALHNQAIMEFGALQCKPQQPDCSGCPLVEHCLAFAENEVENRPVRASNKARKTRFFYYLCLQEGDFLWLQQRNAKDIWQHLWEFPLIEGSQALDWVGLLKQYPTVKDWLGANALLLPEITYRHILSHQEINATFFPVQISTQEHNRQKDTPDTPEHSREKEFENEHRFPPEWKKVKIEQVGDYAVSRLMEKFLVNVKIPNNKS